MSSPFLMVSLAKPSAETCRRSVIWETSAFLNTTLLRRSLTLLFFIFGCWLNKSWMFVSCVASLRGHHFHPTWRSKALRLRVNRSSTLGGFLSLLFFNFAWPSLAHLLPRKALMGYWNSHAGHEASEDESWESCECGAGTILGRSLWVSALREQPHD